MKYIHVSTHFFAPSLTHTLPYYLFSPFPISWIHHLHQWIMIQVHYTHWRKKYSSAISSSNQHTCWSQNKLSVMELSISQNPPPHKQNKKINSRTQKNALQLPWFHPLLQNIPPPLPPLILLPLNPLIEYIMVFPIALSLTTKNQRPYKLRKYQNLLIILCGGHKWRAIPTFQ